MDKKNKPVYDENDLLEEFLKDDGNEEENDNISLESIITLRYLKKIIWLLKKKIALEKDNLPPMNGKLKTIINQLNTKIEQQDTIIQLLTTKVEQENTIIDRLDTVISQLETKIALETPQPVILCECSVSGNGSGPVNPALTGQLIIDVCPDCEITFSSFNYNVFNPANQSIREVIGTTFNQVNCNLNEDGDGTVIITGTALVRNGVGGPYRAEGFTLTLDVDNNIVSSFTIVAGNVNDTVNIDTGEIEVVSCS